jgi:hypothetical protein
MSEVSGAAEPKPDEAEDEGGEFLRILTARVRAAAQSLPPETPMAVVYRPDRAADQA